MRLIDANTLKGEFTGNFNGGYYTVPEIHAQIDTAPTIWEWVNAQVKLPDDEDKTYLGVVTGIANAGYADVKLDKAIEFVGWDRETGFYLPEYVDEEITVSYWMEIPDSPEGKT